MEPRREGETARERAHKICELMAECRVKMGSASLGLSVQEVPVGWDSVLEWKRDSDSINYTFNPKADFLLNCARLPLAWGANAPAIFQDLLNSEDGCDTFQVAVEVRCGEVWGEAWSGEFSTKDWKSDRDRKTISVRPKEINPLDCLKKAWKTEENIYAIAAWKTVKPYYYVYKDKQRLIIQPDPDDPCAAPPTESDYCWYETEPIPDGHHTLCVYYYHRFELQGSCSGSTPVQPDNFTTWTLLSNTCPTASSWWTCPEDARVPFQFVHGLRLQDVLTYLFVQAGCGMTVKSDFFDLNADGSAPVNPAYDAALLYCHNLLVFQKSDIKRHDASDPSRSPAWKMKLADLLNDLKILFNVDWRADDNGSTFRLEHISYFDAPNGNDYTDARYKSILEQDKTDAPRLTRFFYRDDQCSAYFKGKPLEIYCGEDEKELRLSLFSCDISFITSDDGLESIGDDGFVLMTAVNVGGTLYNVNNNRPLSWSELLYNFYRHNMAGAGEINGAAVTPLSLKKTRKQPAFTVTHCCDDEFDPADLITTSLGEGQLQSASWNLAKDYLELEAKY